MTFDHEPGDEQHVHESPLLHEQEHKGYGDDEGERDESLDDLDDDESDEEDEDPEAD